MQKVGMIIAAEPEKPEIEAAETKPEAAEPEKPKRKPAKRGVKQNAD